MRRGLAVVFSLQLGAVERKLAANLLDLDQCKPAVVEHDNGERDAESLGGGHFAARHLEAAVAEKTDNRCFGPCELGGDCARKPKAHGRPAVGDLKCFW